MAEVDFVHASFISTNELVMLRVWHAIYLTAPKRSSCNACDIQWLMT